MTVFPTDKDIYEYCHERGLRILCPGAYKHFMEHLRGVPGNYLEIGVFEGAMLRELAQEYPGKMFYGIDPFIEDGNTQGHSLNHGGRGCRLEHERQCALKNWRGFPNIKLFEMESREFARQTDDATLSAMGIGAVFIDGSHHYEDVANDFDLAARALKNGGVIWPDDRGYPGVDKADKEFTDNYSERILQRDVGWPYILKGY